MAPNVGVFSVELERRGKLIVRPGDYVATGGEASIYRANNTVLKVYTDPQKMAREHIADKVKALAKLAHPFITVPEGVIYDGKGQAVGIYMPFVDGNPLCMVFTNAYRQRECFGDNEAKVLAERMRDATLYTHDRDVTMVDANEMNWIVSRPSGGGPRPHAIDVDSWAMPPWGATVIMPSIRDWHTKGFTTHSDWFAWGVVTFQVFTGIHPYRGTLDGFKPGELEARMKANASVFAPGVRLNRAVRDFKNIPAALFSWYVDTFQYGRREVPPSPFDAASGIAPNARIARMVVKGSGTLVFEKLLEFQGYPITRIWPCGAVGTENGVIYDFATRQRLHRLQSSNGEVIRCDSGWLLADWVQGKPLYTFVDARSRKSQTLELTLRGHRYFRHENRLFLVTESELVEIKLMYLGKPLLAVGKRTAILTPQATMWFDGVGVEDALGAKFIVLPFGEDSLNSFRVKELDGLHVVSAKAGARFAMFIALDSKGGYHKIELTLSKEYASYSAWLGNTDSPELNVAILPRGVCATIVNDGELTVFVPSNGQVNRINDKQIATDMALANWNDTVVYVQNGAVWSLRMK